MGTFNERAENLMDELTNLADSKKEAKMLQLFNRVTLDVITKVIQSLSSFSYVICFPAWSLSNVQLLTNPILRV